MTSRKNILVIGDTSSTFVQKDIDYLRAIGNVKTIDFSYGRSPHNILNFIKYPFNVLYGCMWADVVFIWFANIHSFIAVHIAKSLNIKSIVVIGGVDVASIPEIEYGLLAKPHLKWIVKTTMQNSDLILAVDEGLKQDAIQKLGISRNNIEIVPTGYDYTKYSDGKKDNNLIITVALGSNSTRVQLKGLHIFSDCASQMPDKEFAIIGVSGVAAQQLKNNSPDNLRVIEPIPHDQLLEYYQKSSVYCQLSMREGLPNALCEAMLSECVPVGTDVQGVKTAIGNAGYLVPYGNTEKTVAAIKKAFESNRGETARERIRNLFPSQRRQKRIEEIIY